jgi:4-hydroxy-3-polyprenylbenzoate decarboxylase
MGARTLAIETDVGLDEVRALADVVYNIKDLAAAVSGGSFRTRGMIIAPCSVKTLSGIANGFSHNLMIRAADVTLKERRPLVLMVRETPLHLGHLGLMTRVTEIGAIIMPPMPAFYHRPATIMDIVQQSVGRALDHLGIEHDLLDRWSGP